MVSQDVSLTDNGQHWEPKTEFLAGDRPWIAFDDTKGPNHGWMYIDFQSRAGALDPEQKQLPVSLTVTHSADGGTTWTLPRAYGVITGDRLVHSIPVGMKVLSDGTLVMLNWQNIKKGSIDDQARNGTPAGWPPGPATCDLAVVLLPPNGWERPKTVKAAEKYCADSAVNRRWAAMTARTTDTIAVDSYSVAFKDRIYVAWTDLRSASSRIMFVYSADRGETWSKPALVDDVPANLSHAPDNFMPALAVNKDGVVGLSWYDRRENPDNLGYTTRFTASLDGGETWLPSVRVSEQSARFRQGDEGEILSSYFSGGNGERGPLSLRVGRMQEFHGGDTAGLAADTNGVFHALWIDNHSGLGELYAAPVFVKGTVAKHGSADLSNLSDVSERVRCDLSDVEYDPKTHVIIVRGSLVNTSKVPLKGRLISRVLSLTSEVGAPRITNAENGAIGAGALFDFTSLVPDGVLKPEQTTKPAIMKFELRDVHLLPAEEKNIFKLLQLDFLHLDVEILGEPPEAPAPAK